MKVILIRFGELTLKGKNRKECERVLYNNIQKQLSDFELTFHKDRNRIYINIRKVEYFEEIKGIIKKIPGIHSFSIADVCEPNIETIKEVAINNFNIDMPCFKVNTKRSDKTFPLLSQEVSRIVGGAILFANDGLKGMRVDVKNPEQEINIEIQKNSAYVFHQKILGMGGLPIGTAGKSIVLLSGGIDSPVAAIMAMKRGLKITCLHFSSPPYTKQESLQKVFDLVKILQTFDKDIKLIDCNFSEIQLAIHQECQDRYEVTILRRMMLRQASRACYKMRSRVIITGESLGQVASQTIDGMFVTDNTVPNLILRPLITMDKLEIIKLAEKYKTYEISILPYEDCCVIFLPKNPATSPKLEIIEAEEEKIDFKKLIENSPIKIYKYNDLHQTNSILDELM